MITKETFKDMVVFLGYEETSKDVYRYHYSDHNCDIEIDFEAERIYYPIKDGFIVNENQTSNFSKNENFVVFECVHRLLLKGYKPSHIEIERRWSLGHSQKSGRADICVMNETGTDTLFIVECKTYGAEYDKALIDLKNDGGQLFSYWQQDKATKWLSLYASDFEHNRFKRQVTTIFASDDEEVFLLAQKNRSLKTYQQAKTVEQSFLTWKETYEQKSYGDLILSEDTVAYQIGVKPLRKKDLKEFDPKDKIINQFEEILRHNNVSDKENAFNKLLALFICKLVDEIQKDEDDIVDFQYRQGTDTYETLQDRLQRLHKEGMDKFMGEEVFYVSNEYPQQLFEQYKGANRKHAISELKETFRKLKFYSNNDFAFKEVHNEELFLQNGKILVEMVRLFENYRIIYPAKHQFLGDLFEQLLNKGFKQNEGQFFTPTPITRFMWEALPIEKVIKNENGNLPKTIDYSCGSGHFLVEGIELINKLASTKNNEWVASHIYGVEKDYRLARVSKISLFMNGAGSGNIIFGDGLENDETKGIINGTFSVLVANPPYSVKAFKSHLQLKNNELSLLDAISNDGGEIEVLFVERIAQLLKPGAVAAVVLPSSILSNNSNSYIGAREILLRNFQLKGIVQFGSKTFGATGTNTVVLFLQKNIEPPKKYAMLEDSIINIFNGTAEKEWQDNEILQSYTEYVDVDLELYDLFLQGKASFEEFQTSDYLKVLVDGFYDSTIYKDKLKKRAFQALSEDEKSLELLQLFYAYAHNIERDKLLYFALVKDQQTVIATAPSSNSEQKSFLGYDWSNRKGNEGIQISKYGGQLFDPKDRNSKEHIAPIIRASFEDKPIAISDSLSKVLKLLDTKDMFNFGVLSFNKGVSLSTKKKHTISSKYPIVFMKNFDKGNVQIKKGTSITRESANQEGSIKVVAGGLDYAYMHDTANRTSNIITVSASGANAGFVNFYDEPIFASDCTTIQCKETGKTKYLYYVLKNLQEHIYDLQRGSGQPHVYPKDISIIKIPEAPKQIQDQIIAECEKVEQKYQTTRMKIEDYKKQIQDIFEQLEVAKINGGGYRLSDKSIFSLSIGKRVVSSELTNGGIPVYSANVFEPVGYIDKDLLVDFTSDSIIWGIDGDWMVNIIEKEKPFYPTDHCGVLRSNSSDIHPRYLAYILHQEGIQRRYSRSHRASLDRIREISFNAPPIELQNKSMQQVETLEKKIKELEKSQVGFTNKIKEIVESYL